MLQDRFRKKTKRPVGGGDSSLETIDITDQVPQIDDVLAEVDKALKKARHLEQQVRLQKYCGC
jgi:hypothetical protein